jgi:predicted Zn-dependent protease
MKFTSSLKQIPSSLIRVSSLAVVSSLMVSCATPTYYSKSITPEQQAEAEREIASISWSSRNISDKKAEAKIKSIYNRLLPAAIEINNQVGENKAQWNIQYSPERDLNAYAAKKGDIIIYKGVLEQCSNDHEVAFVIAHEISHHIANHINETKQNMAVGGVTGGVLMGVLGALAYNNPHTPNYNQARINEMTNQGMAAGMVAGKMSYTKNQENEADYIGAYIVHKSGYDLDKARLIFARLAKANKSQHNERHSLDTHPAHSVRLAKFHVTASEIKSGAVGLQKRDSRNASSLPPIGNPLPDVDYSDNSDQPTEAHKRSWAEEERKKREDGC